MKYHLLQFDADKLAQTTAAWAETAERLEIPSLEYTKITTWAAGHIDYSAEVGDSYAYGIFAEDCPIASGVVDIIYSRRPGPDLGWLKMIELSLGPVFAPSQVDSAESMLEIIRIYVTAILGTIALTDTHKARVIKLFGRNDQMMTMLASVHLHFNSEAEASSQAEFPVKSKIEGRWLVISVP